MSGTVNLARYYSIVNNTLKSMGVNIQQSRVPGTENQWVYIKGSAFTLIEIGKAKRRDEDIHYIQAFAPICQVPQQNREAFYMELLKYNHNLLGTFFCIHNELAIIKLIRNLVGLNKAEVRQLIEDVGYISDKIDNRLTKVFQTSRPDVTFTMLYELAKVQLLEF